MNDCSLSEVSVVSMSTSDRLFVKFQKWLNKMKNWEILDERVWDSFEKSFRILEAYKERCNKSEFLVTIILSVVDSFLNIRKLCRTANDEKQFEETSRKVINYIVLLLNFNGANPLYQSELLQKWIKLLEINSNLLHPSNFETNIFIPIFLNCISLAGNYSVQYHGLYLLMRYLHLVKREDLKEVIESSCVPNIYKHLKELLPKISTRNFKSYFRNVLNILNLEISSEMTVFSEIPNVTSIGNTKVKWPRVKAKKFQTAWIDFNSKTKSISFFCDPSTFKIKHRGYVYFEIFVDNIHLKRANEIEITSEKDPVIQPPIIKSLIQNEINNFRKVKVLFLKDKMDNIIANRVLDFMKLVDLKQFDNICSANIGFKNFANYLTEDQLKIFNQRCNPNLQLNNRILSQDSNSKTSKSLEHQRNQSNQESVLNSVNNVESIICENSHTLQIIQTNEDYNLIEGKNQQSNVCENENDITVSDDSTQPPEQWINKSSFLENKKTSNSIRINPNSWHIGIKSGKIVKKSYGNDLIKASTQKFISQKYIHVDKSSNHQQNRDGNQQINVKDEHSNRTIRTIVEATSSNFLKLNKKPSKNNFSPEKCTSNPIRINSFNWHIGVKTGKILNDRNKNDLDKMSPQNYISQTYVNVDNAKKYENRKRNQQINTEDEYSNRTVESIVRTTSSNILKLKTSALKRVHLNLISNDQLVDISTTRSNISKNKDEDNLQPSSSQLLLDKNCANLEELRKELEKQQYNNEQSQNIVKDDSISSEILNNVSSKITSENYIGESQNLHFINSEKLFKSGKNTQLGILKSNTAHECTNNHNIVGVITTLSQPENNDNNEEHGTILESSKLISKPSESTIKRFFKTEPEDRNIYSIQNLLKHVPSRPQHKRLINKNFNRKKSNNRNETTTKMMTSKDKLNQFGIISVPKPSMSECLKRCKAKYGQPPTKSDNILPVTKPAKRNLKIYCSTRSNRSALAPTEIFEIRKVHAVTNLENEGEPRMNKPDKGFENIQTHNETYDFEKSILKERIRNASSNPDVISSKRMKLNNEETEEEIQSSVNIIEEILDEDGSPIDKNLVYEKFFNSLPLLSSQDLEESFTNSLNIGVPQLSIDINPKEMADVTSENSNKENIPIEIDKDDMSMIRNNCAANNEKNWHKNFDSGSEGSCDIFRRQKFNSEEHSYCKFEINLNHHEKTTFWRSSPKIKFLHKLNDEISETEYSGNESMNSNPTNEYTVKFKQFINNIMRDVERNSQIDVINILKTDAYQIFEEAIDQMNTAIEVYEKIEKAHIETRRNITVFVEAIEKASEMVRPIIRSLENILTSENITPFNEKFLENVKGQLNNYSVDVKKEIWDNYLCQFLKHMTYICEKHKSLNSNSSGSTQFEVIDSMAQKIVQENIEIEYNPLSEYIKKIAEFSNKIEQDIKEKSEIDAIKTEKTDSIAILENAKDQIEQALELLTKIAKSHFEAQSNKKIFLDSINKFSNICTTLSRK